MTKHKLLKKQFKCIIDDNLRHQFRSQVHPKLRHDLIEQTVENVRHKLCKRWISYDLDYMASILKDMYTSTEVQSLINVKNPFLDMFKTYKKVTEK